MTDTADWIGSHQASIEFLVTTLVGVFLILLGSTLVGQSEPGLIALGAGALGLTGFRNAAKLPAAAPAAPAPAASPLPPPPPAPAGSPA